MFESILRRYARYIPITPSRLVVFLVGIFIVSSIWLYYLTTRPGPGPIRYLIYDNPGKLGDDTDPADISHHEVAALKTALTLGNILNRTVILPTFHCAACKEKSPEGNCIKQEWSQCEFETIYRKDVFDEQFAPIYVSSNFLSNLNTRKSLEAYSSPLYVLDSVLTRTRTQNILPRDIVLLQAAKQQGNEISATDVKKLLEGTEKYQLLRFHSLYFNFEMTDDINKINAQLSKAFTPIA